MGGVGSGNRRGRPIEPNSSVFRRVMTDPGLATPAIRADVDPSGAKEALVDAVSAAILVPDDLDDAGTEPPLAPSAGLIPIRNIVWLRFCGLQINEIAARTGINASTVSSLVKSPAFYAAHERELPAMLERVNDTMREKLQGVILEAIELKVHLMRHGHREELRNRVASELIELGKSALLLGRGDTSDLLRAIHEQATKEKGDGTRTTTRRVTLEGTPEAVAAAMSGVGGAHGDGGDRPAATFDDPAGRNGGNGGPPQAADAPGGGRGDSGDGSGGL